MPVEEEQDYDYMMTQAEKRLSIHWAEDPYCPGTIAITATIPSMPLPMGIVWIRNVGNTTIETLGSFVDSRVRRCGVRTAIHKWILSAYPHCKKIITSSGTDYGMPWLKATGFKLNRASGDWEYLRKKKD